MKAYSSLLVPVTAGIKLCTEVFEKEPLYLQERAAPDWALNHSSTPVKRKEALTLVPIKGKIQAVQLGIEPRYSRNGFILNYVKLTKNKYKKMKNTEYARHPIMQKKKRLQRIIWKPPALEHENSRRHEYGSTL